jgi:hypothetical protein
MISMSYGIRRQKVDESHLQHAVLPEGQKDRSGAIARLSMKGKEKSIKLFPLITGSFDL